MQMWNPEQKYFEVGPHIFTSEMEDIYFLIGFSRHGAPISLIFPQAGDITTQELIVCHCYLETNMLGKNILIKVVRYLPLRTILFIMQRVAGSQGPKKAS